MPGYQFDNVDREILLPRFLASANEICHSVDEVMVEQHGSPSPGDLLSQFVNDEFVLAFVMQANECNGSEFVTCDEMRGVLLVYLMAGWYGTSITGLYRN